MRLCLTVAATIVLALSSSASAQNILASTNSLVASAESDLPREQRCPSRLYVEADEPSSFFDPNSFLELVGAVRIARSVGCDSDAFSSFEVWGFHEGHLLDKLHIDATTGLLPGTKLDGSEPENSDNTAQRSLFGGLAGAVVSGGVSGGSVGYDSHPNFRTNVLNAELDQVRKNIARSFEGKPDEERDAYFERYLNSKGARHLQLPPFVEEFGDFPYLPDRWYKLGLGGTSPNTRYTDLKSFLVGKTYLFYEYDIAELRSHLREDYDPVPLEDRLPKFGITIGADSVEVFNSKEREVLNYSSTQTRPKGTVSCFKSELLGSEECLLILRTEAKYFQPYFLAFVAPDIKSVYTTKGKETTTRYDFDTLGYLKSTSLEIAQAELDIVGQLNEIAALQDAQDLKDGKPKKTISFSKNVSPYMAEEFAKIYSGEFGAKTSIPLERSYGDYGEDQDALIREAIFLGYHQAAGFGCFASEENPRTIFNFVDTSILDTANRQLTSSAVFVRFLSQPVGIPEVYFDAYDAIATLHLLKTHFNYESYRQDFSFRRKLQSTESRLQDASIVATELIAAEGCNSPTLQLFEKNLQNYAFTENDRDLLASIR